MQSTLTEALKERAAAYPKGRNYLICPVAAPYKKRAGTFELTVQPPESA